MCPRVGTLHQQVLAELGESSVTSQHQGRLAISISLVQENRHALMDARLVYFEVVVSHNDRLHDLRSVSAVSTRGVATLRFKVHATTALPRPASSRL
jgi:hypothetical protein